MTLTSEQLNKLYADLPEDVKEVYASFNTTTALQEIGKKYKIHIDDLNSLMDETSLVILGQTHPQNYIRNISKRLEVDISTAKLIAEEVNDRIFRQIRESLKKIHNIETASQKLQKPEPIKVSKPLRPSQPLSRSTPEEVGKSIKQPLEIPQQNTLKIIPEAPVIMPQGVPTQPIHKPTRISQSKDSSTPSPLQEKMLNTTSVTKNQKTSFQKALSEQISQSHTPESTEDTTETPQTPITDETSKLIEVIPTPPLEPTITPLQQPDQEKQNGGISGTYNVKPQVESGEILKQKLTTTIHTPQQETEYEYKESKKKEESTIPETPAPAPVVDPYREPIE